MSWLSKYEANLEKFPPFMRGNVAFADAMAAGLCLGGFALVCLMLWRMFA